MPVLLLPAASTHGPSSVASPPAPGSVYTQGQRADLRILGPPTHGPYLRYMGVHVTAPSLTLAGRSAGGFMLPGPLQELVEASFHGHCLKLHLCLASSPASHTPLSWGPRNVSLICHLHNKSSSQGLLLSTPT